MNQPPPLPPMLLKFLVIPARDDRSWYDTDLVYSRAIYFPLHNCVVLLKRCPTEKTLSVDGLVSCGHEVLTMAFHRPAEDDEIRACYSLLRPEETPTSTATEPAAVESDVLSDIRRTLLRALSKLDICATELRWNNIARLDAMAQLHTAIAALEKLD